MPCALKRQHPGAVICVGRVMLGVEEHAGGSARGTQRGKWMLCAFTTNSSALVVSSNAAPSTLF